MENSQNSFSVSFFMKAGKNQKRSEHSGQSKMLYCRIKCNGEPVEFSLKKSVTSNLWKLANGRNSPVSPTARDLKLYLDRVKAKIVKSYDDFILSGRQFNAEMLKMKFFGIDVSQHKLCELIEFHNENCGLEEGTLKNYRTTFTYVKNFLKSRHGRDVLLTEVDYSFLLKLATYITQHPIKPEKPVTNNGLMKHIERLKKIGNLAVKLKWIKESPFKDFKLHLEETTPTFLNEIQLATIEELNLKNPMLQLVRDIFVFSCYVGPHYGDTIAINKTDLTIGFDGEIWLRIQREKNTQPALVPLLPKAIKIIENYKDDERALNRGSVFPYVSNKTVNDKLKIISELAGLPFGLSFKAARHTFGTTVTLSNNVPIETVSKMMGHRKLSTTQIYARVVASKVSNDMQKLKKALDEKKQSKVE